MFNLITALFFLSGSASLVYQVLWMRSLSLFFGSDLYGVAIILSTFMGGLALGSLVGGRLAERSPRPLMWYGLAEAGIGLFALCFASMLAGLDPLLHLVYPPTSGTPSWLYQLVRIALAAGMLLIPTALMGATLPLIMRHFVRSRSVLGNRAAYFYAVNTFGALAGTLTAGFFLLPQLGMHGATLCAATVNLLIGACCIPVGMGVSLLAEPKRPERTAEPELDPLPGIDPITRRRIARAAFLAFGISGFASFALEVVWTRILIISFSATVYSFASMLACFLFGIFLGSVLIRKVVDRHADPLRLFALLELGVGVCVGALCLLINVVPGLFGEILGIAAAVSPDPGSALVIATLLTSFAFLIVPTTLLGATFSVALRAYTTNVSRVGSRTGNLYFSNTFGAILGSLAGGLVLIPTIGAKASLAVIALLFALNGVYLALTNQRSSMRVLAQPAFAVGMLAVIIAAGASALIPYRVTLNFNQNAGAQTQLLYHKEGIQNTVDIVRSRSGITSLIIGGNVEADDGYTQRRHFVLKGHLPLMLLEKPRSVLVVGLGMGITLRATANHPGLNRIDVIELSPEILEGHQVLGNINGMVIKEPIVNVRIDDGRSYMKLANRRYDMITADPIHPKISRVGYLYTREYYESIRDRLAPGGVICQWMPMYQISPTRLRSAMKSFAGVFDSATFWYVKNHGLLVARRGDPTIDYDILARRFENPVVRDDLASIGIESPEQFLSLLLLGPEEIQAFVAAEPDVPINTDDFPYLEYFVPGDLFYRPVENVRQLVRHLIDPTRLVRNLPPDSAARVRELSEGRKERLVDELEETSSAAH